MGPGERTAGSAPRGTCINCSSRSLSLNLSSKHSLRGPVQISSSYSCHSLVASASQRPEVPRSSSSLLPFVFACLSFLLFYSIPPPTFAKFRHSNPIQPTMVLSYPPLEDRPLKNTICLFDVDGTLTPARRVCIATCPLPFFLLNSLTLLFVSHVPFPQHKWLA